MLAGGRRGSGGSGTQVLLPAAYPHVFTGGPPTSTDREIFGEYRLRVFGSSAGARAANFPTGAPIYKAHQITQSQTTQTEDENKIQLDLNLEGLFYLFCLLILFYIFFSK